MRLILTNDLETVRNKYIDVIENTPQIYQYARWEYGKHPSDSLLQSYIAHSEMYCLMDGETVAGMVAICMSQGADYESVSWGEHLQNDEVATLHLLTVCPAYRGNHLGNIILEQAMDIAVRNEKKALRLDTLQMNLPARKMYERAGFSFRGEQRMYAENTGILDFVYYEKIPE